MPRNRFSQQKKIKDCKGISLWEHIQYKIGKKVFDRRVLYPSMDC